MSKFISVNDNGVIYVENDNGVIFGIVSAYKITDEDGLAYQEDPLTVLENNGFELNQDWENELTYIELTEENGGLSRVVFTDDSVKYISHDE